MSYIYSLYICTALTYISYVFSRTLNFLIFVSYFLFPLPHILSLSRNFLRRSLFLVMASYPVNFSGALIHTTVTSSAEDVDRWLSRLYHTRKRRSSSTLVGLDIEWRPYYRPSDRNPVAIMQICIGHHCLIFQLLHADTIPESLVHFLANPEFTFVGVGVKEDADKLLDDYKLGVGCTLDLAQTAAEKFQVPDFGRRGLKRLAMELIGKVMEKPKHVTLSEWDTKKLSYEQIEYASIDAYVSFELGMFLMDYRRPRRSPHVIHGCRPLFDQTIIADQHQRHHYYAANHHNFLGNHCALVRPVLVYHAPTIQFVRIF